MIYCLGARKLIKIASSRIYSECCFWKVEAQKRRCFLHRTQMARIYISQNFHVISDLIMETALFLKGERELILEHFFCVWWIFD